MGIKGKIGVQMSSSGKVGMLSIINKKVIAFAYDFGLDNPCFLDDTIPQWSSVTTYSFGDIVWNNVGSKGNGTYGCFRSKQDNNLNHQPNCPDAWWTQISEVYPSGNPDWNAWPPYGGFGKTPKYLMLTFTGFSALGGGIQGWPQNPPGPNRTFILSQSDNYRWYCTTFRGSTYIRSNDGGYRCWVTLGIKVEGRYQHTALQSRWYWGWDAGHLYKVGTVVDRGGDTKWACLIEHVSSEANQPPEGSNEWWDNLGEYCDDAWCGCYTFCSCAPPIGGWPAWQIATNYYLRDCGSCHVAGYRTDVVQYGGSHWICMYPHTSTAENYPGADGAPWKLGGTEQSHPCKLGVSIRNHQGDGYGGCYEPDAYAIVFPGLATVKPWQIGKNYVAGNKVTHDGKLYICKVGHTATWDKEPGVGANWEVYWYVVGGGCSGSGLY